MSQEILGTALFRRGAGGGVVRFGLRIWSGGVLGRSILTLLHYWSNKRGSSVAGGSVNPW